MTRLDKDKVRDRPTVTQGAKSLMLRANISGQLAIVGGQATPQVLQKMGTTACCPLDHNCVSRSLCITSPSPVNA